MGVKSGNIVFGATGAKIINLGTPSAATWVGIVVQNKQATNEGNLRHVSLGTTDGTNHFCASYIKDGTDPSFSQDFTDGTLVNVYEEIGGVNTVVLKVAFTSLAGSLLTCNVITANSGYTAYLVTKY